MADSRGSSSHVISLPCPSTALSAGVRRLLGEIGAATKSDTQSLEAGILNFHHLSSVLPDESDVDTADYFLDATAKLAPVLLMCEETMSTLTTSDFHHHYMHLLNWTGRPQLFLECFEMSHKTDGCDDILALLLITSVLERALGDVYLLQGEQCPSMLKDLLLSQQLGQIFGPTVIGVLRLVMGPPVSINIRNLVWHGFPAPAEIPHRLLMFLLVLAPSLGQCLSQRGIKEEDIPHRPPLTFPDTHLLGHALPDIDETDVEAVDDVFHSSHFIQHEYRPLWHNSLTLFKQGRYGNALVLLLPQLEHSLRRVFTAANNCPGRLLTAEATLYTTFDEMLDKYLPSHEENQLPCLIGENCMNLLLDLLVYPEGPRVRDRLSHGEVTLDDLPKPLANALLCLVVALAAQFVKEEQTSCCKHKAVQDILIKVSRHKSIFHPISIARQKIVDVAEMCSQMTTWVSYDPHLQPWGPDCSVDTLTCDNAAYDQVREKLLQVCDVMSQTLLSHNSFDLSRCGEAFSDNRGLVQAILGSSHTPTLYRGQKSCPEVSTSGHGGKVDIKESEIVGLVSRIAAEELAVISQIQVALSTRQEQLEGRQLRSRQRDNLKRLLESLPVHCVMTWVMCAMTASVMIRLDHITSLNQSALRKLQKLLRVCLQYSENKHTFSSLERNKWLECVNLSLAFIPKLKTGLADGTIWGADNPETDPCVPLVQPVLTTVLTDHAHSLNLQAGHITVVQLAGQESKTSHITGRLTNS